MKRCTASSWRNSRSEKQDVLDEVGGEAAAQHERKSCDERAAREAADAANAVTARAAVAEARAEADKKPCHPQHRCGHRRSAERLRSPREQCNAAAQEPCNEPRSPRDVSASGLQKTADDAADAGNAAVEHEQQGCAQPNERATE